MPIKNIEDHIEDEKLDLSVCNLTEVPLPQIVNLVRISFLDLSGNQLTILPANFGAELPHIVKLDLSSNKLKSLPATFHQLSSLVHLDLYSNQIRDLPPSLVHLRKLKFLDASSNPLKPRLQSIVGDCKSEKECQNAAKNLLTHFKKQKEDVLKERNIMAQKTKVEQQQQVKATKTETPKKTAPVKKAQPQKQQQKHNSKATNNGTAKAPQAKRIIKTQAKTSEKQQSGSSLLTKILFITLLCVVGNCFIICLQGDYSAEGVRLAGPRMVKGFHHLVNTSRAALQPEALRKTGAVVLENVHSTAHIVGGVTKKYAFEFQEFLEVYTGDLSPYTSAINRAHCAVYGAVAAKCQVAWVFIAGQDWARLYAFMAYYLTIVYENLLALWNHPSVVNARAQAWHYLCVALELVGVYFAMVLAYLDKNVPVWWATARLYSEDIVSSLKSKINSLLN